MAAAVMAVHALKKRKEDMEYDILSVFHRYDADGSGELDADDLSLLQRACDLLHQQHAQE